MTAEQTRQILVVDDDQVFRTRLARAFRNRGHEVFESATATEALQTVTSHPGLSIVLDLRLGSESGISLLPQILEQDETASVVVLTGYGTIATAVQAIKMGAVQYLSKPVDAETILSAFAGQPSGRPQELPSPPLSQIEWEHIQRVVQDCGGNISQASKLLGLHRRSLQRKLAKNPPPLR